MEKKPGIKLSETSGNGQRGDATWGNDVFDAKNSDFQTSRAVSIWELLGPVANKSTSEQIGKLLLIVTFSQKVGQRLSHPSKTKRLHVPHLR